MYKIDYWINEGSGWVIEIVDAEYVNISAYSPLSGSIYIKLPHKLRNSMKGLINIKNNDNISFLWCHIRHLNPLIIHPQRITKADKYMANELDNEGIEFPYSKKDFKKIEQKNNICINVFCYENGFTYPVHIFNGKFKNCMDLLMITDEINHTMSILKILTNLCVIRQSVKINKTFTSIVYNVLVVKKFWKNIKEVRLKINGEQTVKLRSSSIKFKNYVKQLAVPFKIYADFECNVKRVKSSDGGDNTSYTEKDQDHIPCSFPYKILYVDDKFSKPVVLYRGKNTSYRFIEAILKEYDYCKKVINKHFNKNLIMSAEDEERFQLSNKCWISDKLFDVGDNKVRDHCHITRKYRGSAHWSCNVNLGFTKKVPIIFHNLRGCDSHLIMQEIDKFDVTISVIPNGLEKYMAFTINKNLVFIDSMQFMNSSLNKLVKNLTDTDFKYLSQEFSGDLLKLVKQKGLYPYEYMDRFEKFSKDKLPDRCEFLNSLKNKCITKKNYSHALGSDAWNKFKMKSLGDYHDLYLKTDVLLLTDVFEKFINTCLGDYGLDPCHYVSSHGLSWYAMLQVTGIEL